MSSKSCALCLLLFFIVLQFQCRVVRGTYQLEYMIEVNVDGSAVWTVEQKGIAVQASLDRFAENTSSLLKAAQARTQRNMATKNFSMSVIVSGYYNVVKYQCRWDNFSSVNGSQLQIGDVFEVENFFGYLYGDGTVVLRYPQNYMIESVSPAPNEQDSSAPMLEWYGIQEFKTGEPSILLRERSAGWGFFDAISRNVVTVVSLVILVSGGLVGIYYFLLVNRRRKTYSEGGKLEVQKQLGVEDAEEKVVNLLRAAGGSLYQSTISEQCRFSRAKTSKLLKTMEERGKIKRKDKGREKVVTLRERVER